MNDIDGILKAVAEGSLSVREASSVVRGMMDRSAGYVDLGFARADIARARRQGVGEVIYGEGKTADQIARIALALADAGQPRVLITRLDADKAGEVQGLLRDLQGSQASDGSAFAVRPVARCASDGAAASDVASAANPAPDAPSSTRSAPDAAATARPVSDAPSAAHPALDLSYSAQARLGVLGGMRDPDGDGVVCVACAGTSDVPVAEEAVLTARFLGNQVERLYDVGVAGIHRLLSHADVLERSRVVIAVAGMEGALASVVGGMVSCPVIAVPTSVGYGASFGGVTALLAMLNSCASGVSVVNIDNGFGAAYQASLINHLGGC